MRTKQKKNLANCLVGTHIGVPPCRSETFWLCMLALTTLEQTREAETFGVTELLWPNKWLYNGTSQSSDIQQ